MSSPREAVYDVLTAKRRRAAEAEKRIRDTTLEDEWSRYEANNNVANADYRGRAR